MKTIEQTRRALFEAWYKKQFPYADLRVQNLIGTYTKSHADLSWQSFNAALDAVVIELPSPISEHNTDINGFVNPAAEEYDGCLDDCRTAIESTNLGIKIR